MYYNNDEDDAMFTPVSYNDGGMVIYDNAISALSQYASVESNRVPFSETIGYSFQGSLGIRIKDIPSYTTSEGIAVKFKIEATDLNRYLSGENIEF